MEAADNFTAASIVRGDRSPARGGTRPSLLLSDAGFEGLAVSQNDCIVDANSAFAALFGYESLHQIIGMGLKEFAGPGGRLFISQNDFQSDAAVHETPWRRRDGSTFHAELRGRQILWRGAPAQPLSVWDVGARKETEDSLRRNAARLDEAQRVAKMGSWDYDVVTGAVTWSEAMFPLFQLDRALGTPDYQSHLALYHPDDAVKLHALVIRSIEECVPFKLDLRLASSQGSLQWRHAAGDAVPGPDGRTARLTGVVTDVTERMLTEERFRVLFEHSYDAHLFWDKSGLIDCNEAAITMFRCANKAEMLATHPAVFSPEYQPDGRLSAEKRIEIDRIAWASKRHRFEWTHKKRDGEEFPVEVTLTPVTLAERPVMLVNWHDLTERRQAEQQIKDYAVVLEYQKSQLEAVNSALSLLATTDGLTGLKNHRAFQDRLALETDLAARHCQPLAIVMIDVDRFKQFNDAFGHPEGDEVLRQTARILLANVRESDMAARYGGEEFAVLLPQTETEGAAAIAERIRGTFEQTTWSKRSITVSVGVSGLWDGRTSNGDLVSQADKALYSSKSNGRNRVTIFAE